MAQPPWTVEETIIALDVYIKHRTAFPEKADSPVTDLSEALRQLAISSSKLVSAEFRDADSVFKKLRQFQNLDDPAKGLKNSTNLDKALFDSYETDPVGLAVASEIAATGRPAPDERVPAHVPSSYGHDTLSKTDSEILKKASEPALTGGSIVQPHAMPVGTLLKQEAPFEIPRYQRSYAWDEDELIDFARDIRDLAVRIAEGSPDVQHFFGGLVVVRSADGSVWEVIDGQQRITTFLLLLAQVKVGFEYIARRAEQSGDSAGMEVAKANAEDLAKELIFVAHVDPLTGLQHERPRLTPTKQDQAVFEAVIRGESVTPTRASHELLLEARALLWRELVAPVIEGSSGTDDERRRGLLALQFAVLSSSVVIQLKAQDLQAAYRLFMVLNDRGMQLSEGDLLRAATLDAVEKFEAESEAIAQSWDTILQNDADQVQGFLRAYYPSVTGKRADIHNLVDAYKSDVLSMPGGRCRKAAQASALAQRVAGMATEIDTYNRLSEGTWPYKPSALPDAFQVRVWRLVRTLKHDLAVPLLLASSRHQAEREFAELVMTLERFAFRYKNVCGGHPDAAAREYYKYAKLLRAPDAGSKKAKRNKFFGALGGLIADDADDATFEQRLRDRLAYSRGGQRNNMKWLLAALEDFRGWLDKTSRKSKLPELETVFVLDIDATQLDHIYPQSPDLPDPDLEPDKHRLGNIALLKSKDNTIASNTLLAQKKKIYRAQNLEETSRLARKRKWKKVDVEARETRLVDRALGLTRL